MAPELPEYPPGYRFVPTDVELVVYYLTRKTTGLPLPSNPILEVQIYDFSPNDIFENHQLSEDKEWYFFSSRTKKYPRGGRPNRAAGDGFWKATGGEKNIYGKNGIVGCKTSLAYFEGTAKDPKKTNWLMTEYKIKHNAPPVTSNKDKLLEKFVLCKLYLSKRSSTETGRLAQNEHARNVSLVNPDRVYRDMTLDEMMQLYQHAPSFSGGEFIPQPDPKPSNNGQIYPFLDLDNMRLDEVMQFFQGTPSESQGEFIPQSDPHPSYNCQINPIVDLDVVTLNDMDSEPSTSGSNGIYTTWQNVDNAQHQQQFLPPPYHAPFDYFAGSGTGALHYQSTEKIEDIAEPLNNLSADDKGFFDPKYDFFAASNAFGSMFN